MFVLAVLMLFTTSNNCFSLVISSSLIFTGPTLLVRFRSITRSVVKQYGFFLMPMSQENHSLGMITVEVMLIFEFTASVDILL